MEEPVPLARCSTATVATPRQNRVLPDGRVVAVTERGTMWGNRGSLLDRHGRLARYSRGRGWVICLLEFKGRHRTLAVPGRLTELFFLDEATGLAAGHRPCGECRRPAYRAFRDAWALAHPDDPRGARAMDARLHADRLSAPARRRTFAAPADHLPDGTIVERDGVWWLVLGDDLVAWHVGGYGERRPRERVGDVTVLTPLATVRALASGYRPLLHPSAGTPTA